MARFCTECGSPLRDGARFCENCGASVPEAPKICARCGAELEPGAAFCTQCGHPAGQPAEQAAPQASAPQEAPCQETAPQQEASPAAYRTEPNAPSAPRADAWQAAQPASPQATPRSVLPLVLGIVAAVLVLAVVGIGGFVRPGWFTRKAPAATTIAMSATTPAANTAQVTTLPPMTSATTTVTVTTPAATTTTTTPAATTTTPATTTTAATTAATTTTTAVTTTTTTTATTTTTTTVATTTAPPATTTGIPNTLYDFTEPKEPQADEFDWMDAIPNEGFPDGARYITDNLAINGYWKGMHIYMQEGDEIARELVIYEVQCGQRAATVTLDWQQINYGEGWENEAGEDPLEMNGAFDTGTVTCFVDNAQLELDRFWEIDGVQYAVGVLTMDSGGYAYVGLIRP